MLVAQSTEVVSLAPGKLQLLLLLCSRHTSWPHCSQAHWRQGNPVGAAWLAQRLQCAVVHAHSPPLAAATEEGEGAATGCCSCCTHPCMPGVPVVAQGAAEGQWQGGGGLSSSSAAAALLRLAQVLRCGAGACCLAQEGGGHSSLQSARQNGQQGLWQLY